MTAAELDAEIDRLRTAFRQLLSTIETVGTASAPRREYLIGLREDCRGARHRVLAAQRRTLTASLPPPVRGRELRRCAARLAFLDSAIPSLDTLLSLEAAA